MINIYILILSIVFLFVCARSFFTVNNDCYIFKFIGLGFNIVIILFVIFIMAHSTFSDIAVYKNWYIIMNYNEKFAFQRFEPGYGFFMYLCVSMGADFYHFKLILFAVCWGIICYVVSKLSGNIIFFTTFFLLYEIFFDGIQFRNFIAVCLVFLGLRFLIDSSINFKKSIVLYVICIIIASLFHSSSIIYFLFVFIRIKPFFKMFSKNKIKIVYLFGIAILTLLARHGLASFIMGFMSEESDVAQRFDSHSGGNSRFSPIYLSLLMLLYFVLICIICTFKRKKKINDNLTKILYREKNTFYEVAEYVEMINYISLLFIPIVFISTTYYRMIRTVALFDIMFCSAIWNKTPTFRKKGLLFFCNVVLIIMWGYYDLVVPGRLISHISGYLQ